MYYCLFSIILCESIVIISHDMVIDLLCYYSINTTITTQIEGEVSSGLSSTEYAHSEVVVQVTDTLDELNK